MKKISPDKVVLLESQGNIKFPKGFIHLYHTHIFCQRGSFDFIFNEKSYTCKADEFVFWFADSRIAKLNYSKNFKASVLLVEKDFLFENLPDQSRSIDAVLHSREYPVLHISDLKDKKKIVQNFHLLHNRYLEKDHRFYEEALKLQMQIFILEMWHTFANEFEHLKRTLQGGTLYERFFQLVQENCMQQREVQYYALRLNITAKHLNYICKQNTGVSASEWIQRNVRERIILLLQNKNLNISEIVDKMQFSSRSFFTRYVKKVLGMTPTEYRNRLE